MQVESLIRGAFVGLMGLALLPACGQDVELSGAVDDDTLDVLAEYKVEGDEIVVEADPDHEAVWVRFTEFFEASTHPEVTLFVAIDVEGSGGTDGAMQINALDPSKYYLALDVSGVVLPDELDRTMIHEFAHLLTLRASQVPRDEAAIDTCDVYTDSEGCPGPDSYVRAFNSEFWPGYLVEDADNEGPDAAEERWASGEFVTDYAATSPGEDIAEVFAEWVLQDTSPTGDSVVERKLRFFDDYPEVVELREAAREAL